MGSNEPYTNDSPISAVGQNEAHWRLYRKAGLNTIRQLQDRNVDFSADGGEWAEAYVDSNGRKNSVDTTNSTEKYAPLNLTYLPKFTDDASGDTTSDPNGYTNPSYAFDNDDSTFANKNPTSSGTTIYTLGKTFSPKKVDIAYIKCSSAASRTGGTGGIIVTAKVQTYDGSLWTDHTTLYNTTNSLSSVIDSFTGAVIINDTIQGIRIKFTNYTINFAGTNYTRLYTLEYGDMDSDGELVHNIPSGTFSDTISSSFGTALVADWETGANIQYKLTNDTEDSGWLDYNKVSTFTPFTSEPTRVIVKLVPKSSGATAGYPSIKGFSVQGWGD